jgi:VWFA-related protein
LPATEHILAAAGAFVRTSHPQDEIFALAFNDRVRAALPPDAPFTSDADTLHTALRAVIAPWGRTALHDAILAGLRYADRGTYPRKVLVVVGDGGDNASVTSFDDVVRHVLASNTAIYTIAIVDPLDRDANPRRLRQLAELTGGEAFRPGRIRDVSGVIERIARDIRHTYTIGYVPATSAGAGETRHIQVVARAPDRPGLGLSVRTRQRYAGEEEAAGHGR